MSELHDRHRAVLPDWLALYYEDPLEITHGEGRHVWDAEGNKYLDFFGGILTTMTAHALPEVTKAVSEQAGRIIHSSTLYLNRPMVELAERDRPLSAASPTPGSSSPPPAPRPTTPRCCSPRPTGAATQILAMRNSYHGRSFSAVGITGNRGWSPTSLSPLQTLYVHGGVRSRGPFAALDDAEFIEACVADLKDLLGHTRGARGADRRAHPGRRRLHLAARRAVRGLPRGAGRARHPVDRRRGADRLGPHRRALLGLAGARRDGPPDIVTFAKGIGNGMSIGGVVARSEIMNCLDANSISTFGGTQITMAAGLANLSYLLEHDLQGNARRVGGLLIERLRAVAAQDRASGRCAGAG